MSECQKIEKGGLDQYGAAERFGRLIFATVGKSMGLKGLRVNTLSEILMYKAKMMMTNKLSRTPADVVKDANGSHDDVDDLECEVPDVGKIQRQVIIFRRGCRDVVPEITRQRCVLHRR